MHEAMTLGFRRMEGEFAALRAQMAQFQLRVADRFGDVDKRLDAVETTLGEVKREVGRRRGKGRA